MGVEDKWRKDGDGIDNIEDIVSNVRKMEGTLYDYSQGKYDNLAGKLGFLVCVDIPKISYAEAGYILNKYWVKILISTVIYMILLLKRSIKISFKPNLRNYIKEQMRDFNEFNRSNPYYPRTDSSISWG